VTLYPPLVSFSLGLRKEEMQMIRRIACLVTFGLILSGITAMAGDSEKEAAAVSAAERWHAMVDSTKYAESWNNAAGGNLGDVLD